MIFAVTRPSSITRRTWISAAPKYSPECLRAIWIPFWFGRVFLTKLSNCLKDNIFITAGKRSVTRGIGKLKNVVWKTEPCIVRSSRALSYMVCWPEAALRLHPVMQIQSFGLFSVCCYTVAITKNPRLPKKHTPTPIFCKNPRFGLYIYAKTAEYRCKTAKIFRR